MSANLGRSGKLTFYPRATDNLTGKREGVRLDADTFNNALAETLIGLDQGEVMHRHGPWRHLDHVEYATLEWGDGFNHRRLPEPTGNVPPAELEQTFYRQRDGLAIAARLYVNSLLETRGRSQRHRDAHVTREKREPGHRVPSPTSLFYDAFEQ